MSKGQQAISAGHQQTLEAAEEILKAGGNAFDAAIAAALAMFITEPVMASAGAGGFAMCHTPSSKPLMLDFFAQTPRSKPELLQRDFYPIDVNFGNEVEVFHIGLGSSAVPGTIAGIFAIHKKFGTMPFTELLQPAMQLAKNGVVLDTFQGMDLTLLEPTLKVDAGARDIFFKDGKPKEEGDHLYFPFLADFFEFLKSEGETGFYKGAIGEIVDRDSREKGGYLRRVDFEKYQAIWRKPLNIPWHNNELYLPNGPSLGGAIMALVFAYLDMNDGDWAKTINMVKERYQHPIEISNRLEILHPELDFHLEGPQVSTKGTSHFNVADKWGNSISFTSSLGEGSGYFIPGTNMQLNNMMGESFLLPDGFHSWKPNVRLNSMMTPTLVLDGNNQLKYTGGSGGAGRIPFMIAQVVKPIFDDNASLLDATLRPRVHVQDDILHFEKGAVVNTDGYDQTEEWDYKSLFFGGVNSIYRGNDGHLEACGDARRYGVSKVF